MSNRDRFRPRYNNSTVFIPRPRKPKKLTLGMLKRRILRGEFRGYTVTRLAKESGFSRHKLRHGNITTLTLARGEMDFRLRDSDLAKIWKMNATTINNRRATKWRRFKPEWFNQPRHPLYQAALKEEQQKAELVFRLYSSMSTVKGVDNGDQ